jgi:hypothetical protein
LFALVKQLSACYIPDTARKNARYKRSINELEQILVASEEPKNSDSSAKDEHAVSESDHGSLSDAESIGNLQPPEDLDAIDEMFFP